MARAWKVAPTDTVATMLDDARAGDTLTVDWGRRGRDRQRDHSRR